MGRNDEIGSPRAASVLNLQESHWEPVRVMPNGLPVGALRAVIFELFCLQIRLFSLLEFRALMGYLYKRWDTPRSTFGDFVVVGFLIVQCLDGALTYLGMSIWGPDIEANPLISSAIALAGPIPGLAGAKLVAIGFGIMLHLRRVHNLVALLTLVYLAVAILPWAALFLTR
jgi:hypothetical protein